MRILLGFDALNMGQFGILGSTIDAKRLIHKGLCRLSGSLQVDLSLI